MNSQGESVHRAKFKCVHAVFNKTERPGWISRTEEQIYSSESGLR